MDFRVDFGYKNIHTHSMKTAISIPDVLFEAADVLAHKLGISRSELYRRAVAEYIRRTSREAVTEALDAVYGSDAPAGALDPAVAWMQGASLWRREGERW